MQRYPYKKRNISILSLVPTSRGTGYVVAETPPLFVVKRSVLSVRPTPEDHLKEISRLLAWTRPDVLLLEDVQSAYFNRQEKTRKTVGAVSGLGRGYGIHVQPVAKEDIFTHFNVPDSVSKTAIARMVADFLDEPSITKLVPNERRLWDAEPYWMPMFEALALVLTALKADRDNRS